MKTPKSIVLVYDNGHQGNVRHIPCGELSEYVQCSLIFDRISKERKGNMHRIDGNGKCTAWICEKIKDLIAFMVKNILHDASGSV